MTIIKDSAMEPYYIGKDNYCYTVYEVVIPDQDNTLTKDKGKVYEKPVGHYQNLGNALECVAKSKTNQQESYSSIKGYIESWKTIKEEIKQLVDLGI